MFVRRAFTGKYYPLVGWHKVTAVANRPPKEGEKFLKPTRQKGVWEVRQATQDHRKYNRVIVKVEYVW